MCSVIISLLPVKVTGYVTLVIAVKIIRLYNAICSASGALGGEWATIKSGL